jgi:hypothetical protein
MPSSEVTHGVITKVTLFEVTVLEHGTGKRIFLPADLPAFKRPRKAAYKIESTGEVIQNPDYVTNWVIETGKEPTAENLAAWQSSATSNWMGIGTTIYGRADVRPDGSFIATKWNTILMLPVNPIASFRIYDRKATGNFGYGIIRHRSVTVKLNEKQIASTFRKTYTIVGIALFVLYLLGRLVPNGY